MDPDRELNEIREFRIAAYAQEDEEKRKKRLWEEENSYADINSESTTYKDRGSPIEDIRILQIVFGFFYDIIHSTIFRIAWWSISIFIFIIISMFSELENHEYSVFSSYEEKTTLFIIASIYSFAFLMIPKIIFYLISWATHVFLVLLIPGLIVSAIYYAYSFLSG